MELDGTRPADTDGVLHVAFAVAGISEEAPVVGGVAESPVSPRLVGESGDTYAFSSSWTVAAWQ